MPEPSPRLLMENRNWYDSLIKMLKMLRSTRIVLLLVLHCTCSQLFAFSIFHVSWHLALIFTAQLLWSILNILNHPPKPSLRTTGPPADSNHPESYPYHMQINIFVLYQINKYLSTDAFLINISGHSVYPPHPRNSDIHSYILCIYILMPIDHNFMPKLLHFEPRNVCFFDACNGPHLCGAAGGWCR